MKLRLRHYKSCDAENIVSWIKDEDFYPLVAFDDSGVVGHLILRYVDSKRKQSDSVL